VNIAIGIGICNTKFNEYSDQYWYLQYKLDDNSYDWYQQYKYSHLLVSAIQIQCKLYLYLTHSGKKWY